MKIAYVKCVNIYWLDNKVFDSKDWKAIDFAGSKLIKKCK